MVTVVIFGKRAGAPAPDSHLMLSFFYSIMCPEAATLVEMDAIESSR